MSVMSNDLLLLWITTYSITGLIMGECRLSINGLRTFPKKLIDFPRLLSAGEVVMFSLSDYFGRVSNVTTTRMSPRSGLEKQSRYGARAVVCIKVQHEMNK